MGGMGPVGKSDGARRRRNAVVAMTKLPAEGRKGRTPRFPLGPDIRTRADLVVAQNRLETLQDRRREGETVSDVAIDRALHKVTVLEHVVELQAEAELALWRELWRTPQAVAWERLHWTREVAQYVRHKVLAENGDLDAAKEARQQADRLGLTPLAMLRLRWEVVADEVAEQRTTRTVPAAQRKRPNLRAVDPG
ncbi:phage terminase small subunit [Allokutzneria albata]|uniref:Terminase small subunit n=1 Tax=Allokutzneria albata TaxID=211114 RepID=A0A1H0DTV0_ALLAB|nr:hypothetical protein [Allokutzneria albata]SDN73580.1 hypothetical protein SAMN04489726_7993 [Allokutzneria albata]